MADAPILSSQSIREFFSDLLSRAIENQRAQVQQAQATLTTFKSGTGSWVPTTTISWLHDFRDTTLVTRVGQIVTYSFLVTNTGNVTLSDVAVNDGPFSGTDLSIQREAKIPEAGNRR